jgi:acetoacetyl-CoA synthetase
VVSGPEKTDRGSMRVDDAVAWDDWLAPHGSRDPEFRRLPFDHPLSVLYSSGTTGPPKCIVHRAGGILLKHAVEHRLHCDVHDGDRVVYFTTTGWMMWNWLVSVLASEAALLLYDGSPFHPDGNVLFDFADATGMTLFGTSAKFLDAVNKAGRAPIRTHRLERLRTMTSTGSTLAPERFDFVYEQVKHDLHLASMSGGTDIISCFVGGNPIGPVWRGEIQARALGMRVDVYDDAGRSLRGKKGELVCTLCRSPRCRWLSGTIPTADVTAVPISSASPASGPMATTSSSRRTTV